MATLTKAEWLEARRSCITGSDAPIILGVSPHTSALELYGQKIGTIQDRDTDIREVGRALEPCILQLLMSRVLGARRWTLQVPDPWTLVHGRDPWLAGTIDAYFTDHRGERGIIEAKAEAFSQQIDTHAGPRPDHYAQVQHLLEVTGLQQAILAVLVGGVAFKTCLMGRDEEFIAAMKVKERAFLKRLENRDPPPPDDSESATRALAALYPDVEDNVVELPEGSADLWDELESLRTDSRDLDRRRREISNSLRGHMANHRFGILQDGRLLERLVYRQKIQARSVTRLKLASLPMQNSRNGGPTLRSGGRTRSSTTSGFGMRATSGLRRHSPSFSRRRTLGRRSKH